MADEYAGGDRLTRVKGKSSAVRGLSRSAHVVELALMSVQGLVVFGSRARLRLGLLACAGALSLSGCAQAPQAVAHRSGKEYFPSSVYGPASARLIADGEPVPKGGGQYLVGHPYTIAGRTYYPGENPNYSAVGMASWYGDAFHGRRTANGEIYDMHGLTAAHPTMPLPSYARVTNLSNGYSVIVRVNDRGPYHGGRVMDVSSRVADVLNFKGAGTAKIRVDYVGRAPMEGSDDGTLLASLRTDGSSAHIDGFAEATMVADAAPAPSVFSLFSSSPAPAPTRRAAKPAPQPAPAAPEPETESVAVAESSPRPRIVNPPIASAPLPPTRVSSIDRALYFAPNKPKTPAPFFRTLKPMKLKSLADNED
jgi:rare lipoprotein A